MATMHGAPARTSRPYEVFRRLTQDKYLMIAPSMVLLLGFVAYLFYYLIELSFTNTMLMNPGSARYVGWNNYVQLFQDPIFWISLKNTGMFVIGGVIGQLVLGLIMALTFNRPFPGNGILLGLITTPALSASLIVGLIWKYFYDASYGLFNQMLDAFGLPNQSLIVDPDTAMWGLLIVYIWQYSPFVFLILLAGLRSLPSEPFEAAMIDGATRLQAFRYVLLPLLKPSLLVAAVFQIAQGFHTFDLVYGLTFGGPGTSTHVMSFAIYKESFYLYRLGYSSAFAVVMAIIALAFIGFFLHRLYGRNDNV